MLIQEIVVTRYNEKGRLVSSRKRMTMGSGQSSTARRGTRNPHLQGAQSCYAIILPWLLYDRRAFTDNCFATKGSLVQVPICMLKAGVYLDLIM